MIAKLADSEARRMFTFLTNILHFFYLGYLKIIAKELSEDIASRTAFFTDSPYLLRFYCNKFSTTKAEQFVAMRGAGILPIVFITSPEGVADYENLSEQQKTLAIIAHPYSNEVKKGVPAEKLLTWPLVISQPSLNNSGTGSGGEKPYWVFCALVVVAWISFFTIFEQQGALFPVDDLLRDMVAYKWGYDYNIPYMAVTKGTTFDYYIGFDWIFGYAHRILGDYAILLPQLIPLTLMFIALSRMLRGAEVNIKVIACAAMLYMVYPRIESGRPSLLVSSIALVLYAYRDNLKWYVKTIIGAIMASMYYMFFLYLGPLVLFDRKMIPALIAGVAGWCLYSHGNYFAELYSVVHSLSTQNMPIGENRTILVFFRVNWIFAVPFVMYFRKDIKTAFLTLIYTCFNQVRYIENMAPLMLSYAKNIKLSIPMPIVFGIACILISPVYSQVTDKSTGISKALPSGSRVLCEHMSTMYQIIYRRQDVKIAPSYTYGWSDPGVQAIVKDILVNRHVDCSSKTLDQFDYLVEDGLHGPVPACLKLVMTEGGKRLWKIKPLSWEYSKSPSCGALLK